MNDLKLYKERYMKERLLNRVLDVSEIAVTVKAGGRWEDITYGPEGNGLNHCTRMLDMAKAYANPSSSQYQDKTLLNKITLTLNYWAQKDIRFLNWYPNVIQVPQCLIDTLLLVGNKLPNTTQKAILKLINREVKEDPADEKSVTANLVWIVKNTIRFALYKNDVELLAKAFERIGKEMVVVTALKDELEWRNASWRSYVGTWLRDPMIEGIQVDYSNLTHGPLLYTGGYGQSLINELSEIIYDTRGTRLFPEKTKKIFVDYLLEHVRWTVRGKTIDYSTMGRELSLNNGNGAADNAKRLRKGLKHLMNTPDIPRKQELQAFAKTMDSFDTSISKLEGIQEVKMKKRNGSTVLGNRSFWKADYMTHHTEKFFVSVRMSSNRTIASETVNWENLKGDYLGDGVSYIYRTGEEYNDIFGAWDWAKIPGATIEQKPFKPVTKQHVAIPGSESDFVGSVSDGKYGGAAMELMRNGLNAKKAWFMFDKEMVALGTDIHCSTENQVITSVNQCLLKSEVTISDDEGIRVLKRGTHIPHKLQWIHQDDIGYIFPNAESVNIKNDKQLGDRNAVAGRSLEKKMVDKDVFSVWFDHSSKAYGQNYQYTVVPGVTREELKEYADSEGIKVLSNTNSTQAVWNQKLNMLQAVFWQPSISILPEGLVVEVDQPCLLILQKEEERIKFTLSSLEYKGMVVTVKVNTKLSGKEVTYNKEKGIYQIRIKLPYGEYAGQSVISDHSFIE